MRMRRMAALVLLAAIALGFCGAWAESGDDPLFQAFLEAYLSTQSAPIGDAQEAWDWACEQVAYFRNNGLDEGYIAYLEANMIRYLPEPYAAQFDAFVSMAGSVAPVLIACDGLLADNDAAGARSAIEPWMRYMDDHADDYGEGKVCFSGMDEVDLYLMENDASAIEVLDLNYTQLALKYTQVLDAAIYDTLEAFETKDQTQERYLRAAARLSPCNSGVWAALAGLYTSDEQRYWECVDKALTYAVTESSLAQIYAELALHYAAGEQPQLADALCALSERYGGEGLPMFMAACYALSHMDYEKPEDGEALIQAAGIQIGFSEQAQRAMAE